MFLQKNSNQLKWYETMTVKMILLGFMALMFLVPLELIKTVIRDRESSSTLVKQEIAEQAMEKAEEVIKASISSDDQDKLVDEYLKKVVA